MANPATEQTLQELLQQAQQMNASLTKLSSVLGKGSTASPDAAKGAKEASDNMKGLNSSMSKFLPTVTAVSGAFGVLSVAIGGVSKIFGVLGGMISGLFDKIGKVAGVLGEFAMVAASGEMKLSNMVDVMSDLAEQIPLVGGLFAALLTPMKMVIQRQEETLEMFRKMSAVGAGVGESLETLRLNARSTGLSMTEYERVVENNSRIFATMGGDVQSGLKLFNKNMQAVMGPGSEVSRSFFGMGYTAEEAAGALANYMRSQGSMNKQGLQDSRASAQAALELAQQTQLLSETTGKRRKQIQDELEEAQKEQNWQAYLAGLTEKEAKEATAKLSYALQAGGKDAGDMMKTKLMTGLTLPLTESAKKQDAITGGAYSKLVDGIANATGSIEDQQRQMAQSNAQFVRSYDQSVRTFGQVSAFQVASGKQGLLDAAAVANRNRQMQDGKMKTEEQIVKEEMAKLEKIRAAGGSDAAALAQQTLNLREFGNIIDRMIGTLAGPLLGPILKLTDGFQGVATTLAKVLEPKFEEFGKFMGKWVDKFTSIKSWEEFKTVMLAFWNEIRVKTGPLIRDVWESVKPVLITAVKELFRLAWEALKELITPSFLQGSDTGAVSDQEKNVEEAVKAERLRKELADAKQTIYQAEQNEIKKKAFIESAKAGMGEKAAREKAAEYFKGPSEEALANAKRVVAGQPPPPDQSQLIRDWAYKIMTRQENENAVPAEIRDKVKEAQNDPGVKKLAEEYRASVEKENAEKKAAMEKAAIEAKAETAKAQQKKPELGSQPVLTPAGAARAGQSSAETSSDLLNKQLAQLITINRDTAEAAQRTANLIASNGNLFRRS